ncbi:putative disease resistance protein RGA3 [Triticum urartu]|uniref:putative disease resistance protein RGA3 n=1 Tax=Triticum urartu TaxID=4572 RepID=UPI002042E42E|nr:putative disease resistance protein RGA3 [Triticum urartu]
MADPISISAAVGWGVTAVGWLASPIIPRLLNKGFTVLDFNATEKLKIVDMQVLQLQRVMEVVDESTYRARLEPLLDKLRSALYEAEDILDDVEYQRLKKQAQDAKSSGSKMDSLKKTLRSAMPRSLLKDKTRFSFPDSVGQFKHLRYFAFVVTAFVGLTLPGAFTKLYHMQVVDFGSCHCLDFSRGEDMMNLVNLRSVISWADFDFPNVGRLIWLQTPPFFRIRREQGYEPHQLKHLNKLQGKLLICGLENVQSKEDALEVDLAGKEKLTKVVLSWDDDSCSPEVEAEVLEGLCPSKYLERLELWNYDGARLPSWMMGKHNGSPKNLKELTFRGWIQLGPAPDLGAFIHLQSLILYNCNWDALAGNIEHLTSLKTLIIESCKNMRSLPTLPNSLEEIKVRYCSE